MSRMLLLWGCLAVATSANGLDLDHTKVLQQDGNAHIRIDFAKLKSDATGDLDRYLVEIGNPRPWRMEANAYDALSGRRILSHFTVASIWRTRGPFRVDRHRVDGKPESLYQRTPDALVCAARSGPPLQRVALHHQLYGNLRGWLVSKKFEWYAADFQKFGGLLVRNLRHGRSAVAPLRSPAFFFVSAYLSLLVAGQNIPVWVYIVIAGMLAFGVWWAVRKVRGHEGQSTDYDMVVIGGGAAGLTAAGMSAVLGARTALISDNKLGGDCTWQGCVPSKSLLKAAKVAHAMRSAAKYGLEPSNISHEWRRIIERVHAIRQHVYEDADAPPNMEKLGVEVIAAQAKFLSRNSVEIGGRVVTSRYFIIATGSRPDIPKIEGMDRVSVLTNETLFELKERPQRLLVLGAGPIGAEMAQAFQRLGSDVTVIGRSARILEHDDAELTAMLRQSLESEGVRLRLGEEIVRFEPGLAHLKSGEIVPLDAVLVATGRRPNMESLQLQAAGVSTTEKGITVDRHCRTNVKNIFACGDITGTLLFTHMAEHTAKVAVMNALLHVPTSRKDDHVSWCTFTDPELAHVGLGEEELRKRGKKFQVYRFPFSRLDRAITESESTGLVKVFANSRGKVLGASILGAHAGEMIAEFALAIEAKAGLGTIASTIHPYPTYAFGNRRAADNFAMKVLTPWRVGWIRRIFGLRGSSLGIVSLRKSIDS